MSTWSSWTGVAVCVIFSIPPSSSSSAPGVPGWRSTKKLPSRKMRGRIFAVASVAIGRPSSEISIVTTALSVPSSASTFMTLPTLTPAMRTGESGRRPLADSNVAWTS